MTNVPDTIREMWADLYRLFDSHYLMPNTPDAWNAYWDKAKDIYEKYGKNERVIDFTALIGDMIADKMKCNA